MTRLFTFFFLALSINCIGQSFPFDKSDGSFDIALEIDQLENDQYNLVASITLDEGTFIISPFSEDGVYGNFSLSLAENSHLSTDHTLLEIPASVEELDPIVNKLVKFVRVNTTYKQHLEVNTEKDFEVAGLIEFVFEPSCVPYDVAFVLSYRSGVLEVKQTKTSISKEYKVQGSK